MNDETIVAVFDEVAHADAAERDLAGVVPSTSISRQMTATAGTSTASAPAAREPGFWSTLFGGEPEHGTAVYDRSLERGSIVLSVRASAAEAAQVVAVLERHAPVDLEERAATFGLTGGATEAGGAASTTGMAAAGLTGTGSAAVGREYGAGERAPVAAGFAEAPQTLELAEEALVVGKRAVNRGTTRVRRFVVETPVEEQVTLRGEAVEVERRPVTDGRPITDANFGEKTIEMAETDEEAVVSKTARIREEVTLNKTARERVETVRDTVRREDVKVETDADVARTGFAGATSKPASPTVKPTGI